ncbi:AmmeMemoRadiSam system radical SAM enzyme [Mesorhizobium sp. M0184]|uniref:AmmeMemoRadiSam system radical SAM enzyme n=1 Tax=Mesorhizobium sp. M0184 TaxID=2956906 RepID=UPI00333D3E20
MKMNTERSWMKDKHPASHWEAHHDGTKTVTCKLSPRNCVIPEGSVGRCGVRGNVDGALYTFNFGKSVEATMEFIETEACYHYRPGAKILSLGNIGCMMSCDFCQNWRTSQVRHLDDRIVRYYTPEQIVDACKTTGVNVISWTYNDPVVWHEFVVATSRLAQAEGIVTLFKSAFYIEPAAVDELIGCIDIFSISLKSMDEQFYRKFTGGTRLQPVLDMIERVHHSDRHLEVSQLIITDRNDKVEDIDKTNRWVIEHLGDRVPLHYVAFHPAYLYMNTVRTNPEILLVARDMARRVGIKYCYIGNQFRAGVADTHCPECGHLQVTRFGLRAETVGIDADGRCGGCGMPSDIHDPHDRARRDVDPLIEGPDAAVSHFEWNAEAKSAHIEVDDPRGGNIACPVLVERLGPTAVPLEHYVLGGVLKRIIVSKGSDGETGIRAAAAPGSKITIFPVLDRAHFPTSTELGVELTGFKREPRTQSAFAAAKAG